MVRTLAPRGPAKSYSRAMCQSVSGAVRAWAVMRAARSRGTAMPSWGMLISSGAEPSMKSNVFMAMLPRPFYFVADEVEWSRFATKPQWAGR